MQYMHLVIPALDHCDKMPENPSTLFAAHNCVNNVMLFPALPSPDVSMAFIGWKPLDYGGAMHIVADCRFYILIVIPQRSPHLVKLCHKQIRVQLP